MKSLLECGRACGFVNYHILFQIFTIFMACRDVYLFYVIKKQHKNNKNTKNNKQKPENDENCTNGNVGK